jgi:hypothetical protein
MRQATTSGRRGNLVLDRLDVEIRDLVVGHRPALRRPTCSGEDTERGAARRGCEVELPETAEGCVSEGSP